MSGYMIVGNIPYKIDITDRVVSKKEIPGSLFVFGVGYIPEITTITGEMIRGFVLLFDVNG